MTDETEDRIARTLSDPTLLLRAQAATIADDQRIIGELRAALDELRRLHGLEVGRRQRAEAERDEARDIIETQAATVVDALHEADALREHVATPEEQVAALNTDLAEAERGCQSLRAELERARADLQSFHAAWKAEVRREALGSIKFAVEVEQNVPRGYAPSKWLTLGGARVTEQTIDDVEDVAAALNLAVHVLANPPAPAAEARDVDSAEVRAEVAAKFGPPVVRPAAEARPATCACGLLLGDPTKPCPLCGRRAT